MKYAAVIVSLAIGAFALPQEASTITSAPTSAPSVSLTPQVSCALNCPEGDVTCQASCLGIARPNTSQAVETTECAEKCDQGDGSKEATDKYSQCVQACINSLFPSSQTSFVGAPAPASGSASSGASATGSASGAASTSPSGTGAGASASGSGTATGSASQASGTGAANSNKIQVAGAGLAGLAMAVFAL